MVKNAFYAQSGGVTSVINASASGLITEARKHPEIGTVYAGKNGIIGALKEELIDTNQFSDEQIEALKYTPGGAFGSCRYKLKSLKENEAEYKRLIEVFETHNIGYFFYNGGGDSQDTANKVSQISKDMGYPITCIGVPKTVDNDLPFTDCCPGFGSVAKYVAISTLEASLDVASMAATSTKVFILEVMGRHAGWIAASSALAQKSALGAPHIILLPEVAFDKNKFIAKVKQTVQEKGFCVVVASEGAQYADGKFLAQAGTTDAFGHAQLGGVAPCLAQMVKEELGLKYHWAVSDYLQRAARHIASKVDVAQAYELGVHAVRFAIDGKNAVMPIIVRTQDNPYKWHIESAELKDIANIEKMLPKEYISADGFGVTDACKTYLAPLIQGEAYPPYSDSGLPKYICLEAKLVDKKISEFAI
jgi:6-phosphofructokinase